MKQKTQAVFMYRLMKIRSKKMIRQKHGELFWKEFCKQADQRFTELMDDFEEIGSSMFAFNYIYAPAYVAFYTAMEKLGLDRHSCDILMLEMNEKMLLTVPKDLLHAVGKAYYRNMSGLAAKRMSCPPKKLHEFDWQIEYRKTDKDHFEIDITRCGFMAYAQKYGAQNMLPGICRVDYMISHYMHVGFSRTGTLAFGDRCCDCKYAMDGECKWDIETALLEWK
jgi:post-segregation antitoxin (ccd killing protein)